MVTLHQATTNSYREGWQILPAFLLSEIRHYLVAQV